MLQYSNERNQSTNTLTTTGTTFDHCLTSTFFSSYSRLV